ncbi:MULTISPECIES: TetR family transcriptional regulator [Nocardia]|uniref:TetR family transcriptional regulator n=1 Tax=Nocardia TaxID=1817 RepID=UPI0026595EFF|nr:TetR family transcriptional regulator [Nocardia sp. PE-7]WKG08468.1 TetR family transcriptional regulator [Nocardia sp. PE-7]
MNPENLLRSSSVTTKLASPRAAIFVAEESSLSASRELTEISLRPAVCDAVEQAAASSDATGVRALRVFLHAGLSTYWPLVKAAPARRIAAYEAALQTLRLRWAPPGDTIGDPTAVAMFREMDDEAADFLGLCARLSGTQWLEPVDSVAGYLVSVFHGAVLRWLADGNDETILVVIDDLVGCLTLKAVES